MKGRQANRQARDGGFRLKNKVRWEDILSVAARLFCEKGYLATTMDDIASELGITKPALYYYINSKHDLLYEICESAMNKLMDGVRGIREAGGGPEERLRELVRLHVNMFSTHGDIINVYLADESELPVEKRDYIRGRSREYEVIYRELVGQLVADGTFREVDVPMVVRAVSGMCNWLSSWYRPDGAQSADDIAEVFLDLVMNGCVAPLGSDPSGAP
jgi:AcrR family transcriptional regulator